MILRVNYVLGPELRNIRKNRLLTQKEAATKVGVSPRTWQLWEDGNIEPRAKHLRALVDWLENGEAAA